jgi:hypothetical protein
MCHFTKRLYFPDLEEPVYHKGGFITTRYDKYPIVKHPNDTKYSQIKPIPPITMEIRMREAWDQFIAQKRVEYGL